MGADIYKAKYKYIFGPAKPEQLYFIDDNVYRSDDGTYELDKEHYQKLRRKMGKLEKQYGTDLKPLFSMLAKEIRKEKGQLSFRIFF